MKDCHGKDVIALRRKLGMTQEEFAREIGVTTVTVNRWENGHVKRLSPLATQAMMALRTRLKQQRPTPLYERIRDQVLS